MATRQLLQLCGRGCHLLIITSTRRLCRVLLVANSSSKRFELAILPDIFPGQRFPKKTDFCWVQVVARIQRGQLGYQLARAISALTVVVFQVVKVFALIVV